VAAVQHAAGQGAASGQAESSYGELVRESLSEFSAGDFAEARALFERAHALQPNARTLRGLGITAFELKRCVKAVTELEAALADARKPLTDAQRNEVQGLIKKARRFVGKFKLELTPANATVLLDGRPSESAELVIDLGEHQVSVHAPGYRDAELKLVIDGGEDTTQRVKLVRLELSPERTAAAGAAEDSGPEDPTRCDRCSIPCQLPRGRVAPRNVAALLAWHVQNLWRTCSSPCWAKRALYCEPMRVFLIHGMGRTRASMAVLARRLVRAGHAPSLFGYSVARDPLDRIATELGQHIGRTLARSGGGRYAVIGHSLGNVVTRLASPRLASGFSGFVMLAPPNRSPALARAMRKHPVYRLLTGDAGQRLGEHAFFEALPTVAVPTLVIAGQASAPWLPFRGAPSDGIVGVAETELQGARHELVDAAHTFIMNHPHTLRLLLEFLEQQTIGSAAELDHAP
jgi:pimeloyl-ACP methyl ester carboxylesterase